MTTSKQSSTGVGPGVPDVVMMSSEIASLYGGTVTFGFSAPIGRGSAGQLTASWSVPTPKEMGGPTVVAQDITVACALPNEVAHNFYAYAYRLMWELTAAIAEALGDDADW